MRVSDFLAESASRPDTDTMKDVVSI